LADTQDKTDVFKNLLDKKPAPKAEAKSDRPVKATNYSNEQTRRVRLGNTGSKAVPSSSKTSTRASNPKITANAASEKASKGENVIKNPARFTEVISTSKPNFLSKLQRTGPAKRYRLKGYANKAYADQVRQKEKRNKQLLNTGLWILLVIILLIIFYKINPIDKIQKIKHLFGL
jgi:hypothetical protein